MRYNCKQTQIDRDLFIFYWDITRDNVKQSNLRTIFEIKSVYRMYFKNLLTYVVEPMFNLFIYINSSK